MLMTGMGVHEWASPTTADSGDVPDTAEAPTSDADAVILQPADSLQVSQLRHRFRHSRDSCVSRQTLSADMSLCVRSMKSHVHIFWQLSSTHV